jgi:hypothetical protein
MQITAAVTHAIGFAALLLAQGAEPAAVPAAQQVAEPTTEASRRPQEGTDMPQPLSTLSSLRAYRSYRASTENDDPASNEDYWLIPPGETRAMLNVSGCGRVSHIWLTTPSPAGSRSWYAGSLETTEIRMYWDGESSPSVSAPLGAFFCAPFDTAREFVSTPIVLAPLDGRGFNMYFPMPFTRAARIELINHAPDHTFRVYFHVDYVLFDDPAAVQGQGLFHARYHVEDPLPPGAPYTLLEAQGRGHYVGTVLFFDTGIRANRDGYADEMARRLPENVQARYWWEGDDRIYVDGALAIRGTGTEDYFGSSWSYAGEKPFTAPEFGCVMNGYDPRDYGRWCLYRWHLGDPVAFRSSIRVTLEHGHNNAFTLVPYQNVAYWYQVEPHSPWAAP